MTQNDQRIVVALGGNAILRSKDLSSYHEQFENVRRSCCQVVQLIAEGYQPIFTHGESHPTHPALLVEVAESSLELDRSRKGSLYARAAVADYWIVNLLEGVVEVYRDPAPAASAAFGYWYRSVTRLAPPATVVPLAFGAERIAVADLLP